MPTPPAPPPAIVRAHAEIRAQAAAPATALPALSPTGPAYPEAGWVPLQHLASPDGRDDFYTADPATTAYVVSALHYRPLDSPGFVYTGPGGAVPVYRYFSPSLGAHFFTADPAAAPGAGWTAQGVIAYLAHGGVTAPGVTAIPTTAYVYLLTPPAPAK